MIYHLPAFLLSSAGEKFQYLELNVQNLLLQKVQRSFLTLVQQTVQVFIQVCIAIIVTILIAI